MHQIGLPDQTLSPELLANPKRREAMAIGRRHWAIAEGYIPAGSHGPAPEMISHETLCVLNAGDREANVTVTL